MWYDIYSTIMNETKKKQFLQKMFRIKKNDLTRRFLSRVNYFNTNSSILTEWIVESYLHRQVSKKPLIYLEYLTKFQYVKYPVQEGVVKIINSLLEGNVRNNNTVLTEITKNTSSQDILGVIFPEQPEEVVKKKQSRMIVNSTLKSLQVNSFKKKICDLPLLQQKSLLSRFSLFLNFEAMIPRGVKRNFMKTSDFIQLCILLDDNLDLSKHVDKHSIQVVQLVYMNQQQIEHVANCNLVHFLLSDLVNIVIRYYHLNWQGTYGREPTVPLPSLVSP